MNTDTWRFQWACVSGDSPKTPFFAVEDIAAADGGVANALFCVYHGGTWYSYASTPRWSAIAMAAVRDPGAPGWTVLAISASGWVWSLDPAAPSERITRIPGRTGITNLATAGHTVHACGMGRLVLQRQVDGSWTDISAPHPDLDEGVIGFTAIAGASEALIYAVGWQGEIWSRAEGRWQREDAPTDANLNALTMTPDGEVYVVGDGGVMLRGRRGRWELVETDTDFNLMDVCFFDGVVHACTDFEVLLLGADGLQAAMVGDAQDAPGTCLKLVAAGDEALYSVGPYDVFVLKDRQWRRLA